MLPKLVTQNSTPRIYFKKGELASCHSNFLGLSVYNITKLHIFLSIKPKREDKKKMKNTHLKWVSMAKDISKASSDMQYPTEYILLISWWN